MPQRGKGANGSLRRPPYEAARLGDYLVRLEAGRVVAEGPIERMHDVLTPEDAGDEPLAGGALIEGTVRGLHPETGLLQFAFDGGEFQVVGSAERVGKRTRCQIFPGDVSLSRTVCSESSIVNRLEARVLGIRAMADERRMEVTLGIGPTRLYSEVTRASIVRLGLVEGETVYAQFKACAIVA